MPDIARDVRILADRARRRDGTGARIADDTIQRGWSVAVLDPLDELTERIRRNWPWCEQAAMRHAWREEESREIRRLIELPPINRCTRL